MSHYLTRNFGLGIEGYTENTRHSFVDNASLNLLCRFPIEAINFAPYVYGGGHQFDPSGVWFGQAGGGFEVRFNANCGFFTDVRYVFTDGTRNFGLGRVGILLSF